MIRVIARDNDLGAELVEQSRRRLDDVEVEAKMVIPTDWRHTSIP